VRNRGSKPAKVVIFSTVHRAADDRIFHKEARSLARAGYEVVLFADAPHDRVVDGVRIRVLSRPSSRFRRTFASLRLIRAILKEKADIHHFHDPELLPVGLLLRLLGKKVIYDAHEDFPKDILSKLYLPRRLRPFLAALTDPMERLAARAMSGVVTATDSIQRRFPGSVALHNYPILSYILPTQGPTLPALAESPFVLYSGVISRTRGAVEMRAAVKLLSRRYHLKLRLLGLFYDDAIRDQTLQLDATRIVDYRGFMAMSEVYRHYHGALAGLVVLHPLRKHLESMPIKMFEYMACGVPTIASDFPLWRRIVYEQGCGLVVDPLDVPQIADAIMYLMKHPEEAKEMGRRGKELVAKKYNWESESKKLLLLYDQLLAKGRGRSHPVGSP